MRFSRDKTRQTKNKVRNSNPPQDERRITNIGPSDSGMKEVVKISCVWKALTHQTATLGNFVKGAGTPALKRTKKFPSLGSVGGNATVTLSISKPNPSVCSVMVIWSAALPWWTAVLHVPMVEPHSTLMTVLRCCRFESQPTGHDGGITHSCRRSASELQQMPRF